MPISGLVVRSTHREPELAEALTAGLADLAHVEVGESRKGAAAVVVDAEDYEAHDLALERIRALPGVCAVDVVFHDFSDVNDFGRRPAGRRRAGR